MRLVKPLCLALRGTCSIVKHEKSLSNFAITANGNIAGGKRSHLSGVTNDSNDIHNHRKYAVLGGNNIQHYLLMMEIAATIPVLSCWHEFIQIVVMSYLAVLRHFTCTSVT